MRQLARSIATQTVFPALLGNAVLADVRVALGDGDPQQISQLEDAIAKYFPHVYRARCSWHIIDRGWVSKVKLAMGGVSRKKRALHLKHKKRKVTEPLTELNRIARKLYRWMFSWAQSGHCDTLEEFQVSKALFLSFIKSSQVTELLGSALVETIVDFLRQHVSHHEDRFCYYARRGLFHLETHSNTSHEGTNNALFNCAAPVMPTNSLEKAVETLNFNTTVKTQNTCILNQEKMTSRKLWSDSPTSDYVTDLCESLLKTEWSKADFWDSFRAGEKRWLTCHKNEKERVDTRNDDWGDGFNDESEVVEGEVLSEPVRVLRKFGVIPKFARVYEVTVNKDGCLVCTCLKQKRMGYPCLHVGQVMKSEPNLKVVYGSGFPLSSVQVFWRQEYYLYGMSEDPKHRSVQETLSSLVMNDTTGVPCPALPVLSEYVVPDYVLKLLHSPAECRVLNYNDTLSAAALQSLKDRRTRVVDDNNVPVGLSQASYFDEGQNDDAVNFIMNTDEFDDIERDHSSQILKNAFYDAAEAINNSNSKAQFEQFFLKFMNNITRDARADCDANVIKRGRRVSSHPSNSKRRKTHGTKHMN